MPKETALDYQTQPNESVLHEDNLRALQAQMELEAPYIQMAKAGDPAGLTWINENHYRSSCQLTSRSKKRS